MILHQFICYPVFHFSHIIICCLTENVLLPGQVPSPWRADLLAPSVSTLACIFEYCQQEYGNSGHRDEIWLFIYNLKDTCHAFSTLEYILWICESHLDLLQQHYPNARFSNILHKAVRRPVATNYTSYGVKTACCSELHWVPCDKRQIVLNMDIVHFLNIFPKIWFVTNSCNAT